MFLRERKVPALLKSKTAIEDKVCVLLTKAPREGYMIKDEFDNDLSNTTVKIFPNESIAASYARGQEIVKVTITCTVSR
jgi:hypothetical protein